MTRVKAILVFCCASVCAAPAIARAQVEPDAPAVSAEYVIGAGDVLGVKFWQQADMSGDVVVRPDGMISVPLLKDVQASGLTPRQLSDSLAQTATRWIQDPNVTVIVRQINSRAVYITGRVMRAGRYPLNGETSVLQLIAIAGGLDEWANAQNIIVMRAGPTGMETHSFNYKAVLEHKDLAQNIELQPSDTVIVP